MRHHYLIFVGMLVLAVAILANRNLLHYGVSQAKGQFEILRDARPIDDVLSDTLVADSIKVKLMLIQEAMRFAASIGLKATGKFESLYDQKGKDVLWNVSACEPFAFENYEWSFPIIGTFSYKGFFDLNKARAEARLLQEKGFDTRIRPVGAWSTLGWFNDPILSNQLRKEEGALVEMVFHELTHATVFVRDSLQFNENLASFIGERAAREFLRVQYGGDAQEMRVYERELEDARQFRQHVLRGRAALELLYASFDSSLTPAQKLEQKEAAIQSIVGQLDTIQFNDSSYYHVLRKRTPNNAYFMSFMRYHADDAPLDELFQSKGSVKAFIAHCKEQFK